MPQRLWTILLWILSLTPISASASMLEFLDTRALSQGSDSIQIGEVTSKWSSYDPQTRLIYTYVKLKVSETVKGTAQKEILIRQPGGESNGIGMIVHGVARFRKGEKALVFLKIDHQGAPTLLGMGQGKYRITRDPKTKMEMAQFEQPRDVEFVKRSNKGYHPVHKKRDTRLPLSELLQTIRSSLK